MRPVIIVGVIVFTEICVISNSFGENFDDIADQYEPEIKLSETDKTFIQSFDSNKWTELVKRLKDLVKSKDDLVKSKNDLVKSKNDLVKAEATIKEHEQKSCVFNFYCAVANGKNLLQSLKEDFKTETPDHKIRPPPFYETLVNSQRKKGNDKEYAEIEDFRKIVQKMYRFISERRSMYPKNIYKNLKTYFEHHPGKYKNIDELQITFCASVMKSSLLFNYIFHRFFPDMHSEIFDGNNDNEFFVYLKKKMPFYHFSITDVDFLNILVIGSNLENTANESHLFRFVKTNLDMRHDITVYKNNVIPQSYNCPKQINVKPAILNIPFTTTVPDLEEITE